MRATTYLFVNEPERTAQIRQLLESVGLPVPRDDAGFFEIEAASDTEELTRLRKALRDAGIDWFERREHPYSDDELAASPLVSLFVTSPEAGMGGPTYGTEYDVSEGLSSLWHRRSSDNRVGARRVRTAD